MELTPQEQRIVEAMKSLHADREDKLKTADHIAKAAVMPKGKVGNILIALVNKRVIRRVARGKAAGYYLL